jgi:hypothetical protein
MPQNYFYSYSELTRVEETIPSMTYATLLDNLVRLTEMGVLTANNPVAMLVAARIVDRTRIARSGINTGTLQQTLREYREHPKAVYGIVKALETALLLKNESESAAYGAR